MTQSAEEDSNPMSRHPIPSPGASSAPDQLRKIAMEEHVLDSRYSHTDYTELAARAGVTPEYWEVRFKRLTDDLARLEVDAAGIEAQAPSLDAPGIEQAGHRGTARAYAKRANDFLAEVLLYAAEERERTVKALKASGARIVAATDATRHRIERNLHDGTQQRLITVLLQIRALQDALPRQPDVLQHELAQMAEVLDETLTNLREISHGLHPAILTKCGIQPALAALARRCPITVNLNISTRRLAECLETAIYYITSEALTNVAKHAHASEVNIDLNSDESIRLAIRDNGTGGADPARGSGLTGLADRVEALDGTIKIVSPAGGGTELLIELPAHSS